MLHCNIEILESIYSFCSIYLFDGFNVIGQGFLFSWRYYKSIVCSIPGSNNYWRFDQSLLNYHRLTCSYERTFNDLFADYFINVAWVADVTLEFHDWPSSSFKGERSCAWRVWDTYRVQKFHLKWFFSMVVV